MTTATVSLWRIREFALLWSGQVVSTLGAQISGTAMPLLVLATTGSPARAGAVGAAGSLPFLIGHLPAGPLVDRWNRRQILLVSELTAGLALATVPLALWWGMLTLGQLMAVAFVQVLCFVFFGLAERAALPLIVPLGLLPSAVAQNEARSRGAALAGPPLGGLLFGLGRAVPFVADALSYFISATALLFLRNDLRPAPPSSPVPLTSPEPLWRSAVTGLRWVWRHPLARAAIALIAVSNLVFQALVLVLVVRARDHGAAPAAIGVMLGIYSGGGLAGALSAARLPRRFTPKTIIIGVNWVWAALLPLFLLTAAPIPTGAIGAACAFIGALWNVVIMTLTAIVVPNELLGRVTSAAMTLSWGVLPLASLGGGLLLSAAGATWSIWVLTAVMLTAAIAAIAATASPAVRNAPPLPTPNG